MFTSPWMTPSADRQSADRRRAWILTSSVLLHGVALATLAGFELWQVAAVAEPPVAQVFEVQLPLPALPAPPEARQQQSASPKPRSAALPPAVPLQAPPPRPVAQPDPLATPSREPVPAADPPPADPQPDGPARPATGPGGGPGSENGPWGPGPGGNDRPLPVGGPIHPPQIVPGTKVQPHYTEPARMAHVQGVVVLQAVIDERGNVIDVQLLKRLPFGLDEEAVKAVSQWKFTPATLYGRPVKVLYDLTVQFEIR
jgi:protein TonB